MVARIVLVSTLFFQFCISLQGQCIDGTEPSCQCDTAPVLCLNTELDGYAYGMSTFLHPDDGPDPMCTGSEGVNTTSHNPTWLAFVAWCSDITLEIAYSDCISNPNSCTSLGIQAAVYSDCSLDPSSAVDCDTDVSGCENNSERILNLIGLISGDTYYLLVDGCCGSACDIEIQVIGECSESSCAGCSDGSEASCSCNTAEILDSQEELDGYSFGMNTFLHPEDGPEPLCNDVDATGIASSNPTWIGFIAQCTTFTLQVAYDNCISNPNSCSDLGIRAAVYSDCSLSPESAVTCNVESAACIDDSIRILQLEELIIGQTYYLLVDGCCGSACNIDLTVLCSCGDADLPNQTVNMMGAEDVYLSSEVSVYTIDPIDNVTDYYWYIDGVEVESGSDLTTFSTLWSAIGEYELCVDISNICNPVDDTPNPICKTVVVRLPPTVEFELAHNGFTAPVDIANANDNRLFIVEQAGYIKIIEDGVTLETPFLDIVDKVSSGGERGLLGLAFHPQYVDNGFFYVNYYSSDGNTIIARYEVSTDDDNVAEVSSEVILLTIDQPFGNHNAGDLNFSPIDGYLYIAMGDGGSGGDPFCYAQDSMSMLGKMLRLDVDQNINISPYYGIPETNPFVDVPGALDEIFQLGLRNPWRFVFDKVNGHLWIADVGQGQKEEVNFLAQGGSGGENFGWKVMEGTNCYDADPIDSDCPNDIPSCDAEEYTYPLFEYGHDEEGGFSITGGYVLEGCRYPYINGLYICTDYVSANSWLLDNSGNSFEISGAPNNVSTFGSGVDGQIYLATLDGEIYRVNDGSIPRVLLITLSDSPLSDNYEALDSIIITDDVVIEENRTITLNSTIIKISESTFVPNTSGIIIVEQPCED